LAAKISQEVNKITTRLNFFSAATHLHFSELLALRQCIAMIIVTSKSVSFFISGHYSILFFHFSDICCASQKNFPAMFGRLKKKWKVNGFRLALILITFAIGGSVTAFAVKKIMNASAIRHDWLWTLIYIVFIIVLWPIAVLFISNFFGQFNFFSGYVKGLGQNILGIRRAAAPVHIAIFASGAGSNAQKIIDHFRNSKIAQIALVVCNKPGAGVISIAEKENIPLLLIDKEDFFRGDGYVDALKEKKIDLIVLAGFLWKIPSALIKEFPKRIINIHPALLPKYGGKGMYGNFVHEAVLAAGDKQSGITVHFVDDQYDHGDIIFQQHCDVPANATASSLAACIHRLEHEYYPKVIEQVASKL
jgi:formyltetrahydrofolate-dependent phosphoribosylglycinamide formyltransferase